MNAWKLLMLCMCELDLGHTGRLRTLAGAAGCTQPSASAGGTLAGSKGLHDSTNSTGDCLVGQVRGRSDSPKQKGARKSAKTTTWRSALFRGEHVAVTRHRSLQTREGGTHITPVGVSVSHCPTAPDHSDVSQLTARSSRGRTLPRSSRFLGDSAAWAQADHDVSAGPATS